MPLKTSFFNKTVFFKNSSRFWPLWGIYLAAWLLFLLSTVLGPLDFGRETGYTALGLGYVIMQGVPTASVFTALGSLFAAMAVYAYMYSAKSANMLSSLPIRRESLFLTSFFSGLAWLLAAPCLALIVTGLIEAGYGVFGAAYLLKLLAAVVLQTVFFYGLASFCAVLTGHIVVLPVLFAVINLLAYVLEELVYFFFNLITYGLAITVIHIGELFSPFIRMLTSNVYLLPENSGTKVFHLSGYMFDYKTGMITLPNGTTTPGAVQYNGWAYLAVCAAAGILFAVFAVLIYRKRHMETASDVVAVAPLKPVFKYAMTLGGAVILGGILYALLFNNAYETILPGLILTTLIGTFIGYFSSEMLLNKSLRVFRKWRGFAVSAFILLAVIFTLEFDLLGFERKVPEAGSIETATVSISRDDASFSDEADISAVIRLHETILSAKKENESRPDTRLYSQVRVEITYQLENGKTLSRSYPVIITEENLADETSSARKTQDFWNSSPVLTQRMAQLAPSNDYDMVNARISWFDGDEIREKQLSAAEAADFYTTCVLPDIEDQTLGQYSLLEGSSVEDGLIITFTLSTPDTPRKAVYTRDEVYTRFDIHPTENSFRTNAYLKSLGIDISGD